VRGFRGYTASGRAAEQKQGSGTPTRLGARRRNLGALAVVGCAAILLAACGSSSGSSSKATTPGTTSSGSTKPSSSSSAADAVQYGALPAAGTPTTGGTITYGQINGDTPNYIFPITPSNQSSVFNSYEFYDNLYLPLYASPTGAVPKINEALSVAKAPVYSDADKTVTIPLNTNYKWSTGAPVDAQDVIFYIDLLKAAVKENPVNFGDYTPGFFPDNVASATATGKYTVVLKLTKAYNPGYYTNDQLQGLIYPLPSQSWDRTAIGGPAVSYSTPAGAKSIYDFLAKQAADLGTYATSPIWSVVDGPVKLASFTSSTGSFTFVPNPSYGGTPKMTYSALKYETFTTYQAEFDAFKAGTLDFGQFDQSDVPQISSIKSNYSVYGEPDFGFNDAFFNFKDTTGHFNKIIAQLYVRQALAELVDQAGIVTGVFKGTGGQSYGPVPAEPSSPYTPTDAVKPLYPYSISAASKLLSSHGWKVVPNGQTTCQKAGSGAGECGAGIPAGTPLAFNWFYTAQPPLHQAQDTAIASSAAQAGIKITLTAKTFNFLIQNYDNPSAKSNINKWAVNEFGGFTDSDYPTTNSIFNTTGTYNIGSYSDPKANALINASVYGANPDAVKAEASYLTAQVPALFEPNPDLLYAVSKKMGGTPDAFMALTQYTVYPQFFYLTK
jgi:peptide/nickel transport system substrate-binding protein